MLEENEYKTEIQAWDFEDGDNFVAHVSDALEICACVIFVLSKKYFESAWCKEEWTSALAKGMPMIPIRIEKVEPPGLLNARSYVDFFGLTEEAARKKLLDVVEKKINGIPRVPVGESPFLEERVQGLPYPRNPHFTGRDDILRTIHQNFGAGDTVAITQSIAGLGGIGKTQTAMEYAYRYAAHYKTIWWVAAETPQTTQESFLKFVRKMQLLPPDIMEESIITGAVQNWLSQNEGWLFIYDNAAGGKQLEQYLPRTATGHVLITTRDTTMKVAQSVSLNVFSPEDALDFLAKRTGIQDDETNAALLAERLGHLPLALEQAAAYIYENSIGYADYLELLEEYDLEMFDEEGEITHYDKSVNATWMVSMKMLKRSAKHLLYLCSFLSSDNIDIRWFRENNELLPPTLLETCTDERCLNQALTDLVKYSLVQRKKYKISMHRLFQEVIQLHLIKKHRCLSWSLLFFCVCLVEENCRFEFGNVESNERFVAFSTHALAVAKKAEQIVKSSRSLLRVSNIYDFVGRGYFYLGLYDAALKCEQQALCIREKN